MKKLNMEAIKCLIAIQYLVMEILQTIVINLKVINFLAIIPRNETQETFILYQNMILLY